MRRFLAFAVALLLFAQFGVGEAFAQVNLGVPDQSVQGLLDIIRDSANGWDGALRGYASSLFWSLATIQFVITFFPLVIRNGDFSEIIGELIKFVLVIGFFAALLRYSNVWATAIVDSFRQAGATASGVGGLSPGDMFGTAVDLSYMILDIETWNPLTSIATAFAAVVVLLCFAFVAAFMAVTLIESYIVINASVLFMGFGGSQWTREYSIALLRYAVAVGAKLFVLTLLVGVILNSATTWTAAYSSGADDASMLTIVGLALVCAYMCRTVPDLIQGLITGVSPGGGGGIGSMAAIGVAAATAGVAALAGSSLGAGAGNALGKMGGGDDKSPASGSGGIANALKGSMSGGSGSPSPLSQSGGGASSSLGSGQRTGGGGSASSAKASGAAPQMGGSDSKSEGQAGAGDAQASNPDAQDGNGAGASTDGADSTETSEGSSPAPQDAGSGAGAGSAAEGQNNTSNAPSAAPNGGGAAAKGKASGSKAHTALAAAVRGSGMLAAMSVPGMESSASLSIGPKVPGSADSASDESEFQQADEKDEENIIAPAQGAAGQGAAPTEQQQKGKGE